MLKRTNCHGYRGSPQREPHGRREGPRDALNEACQADSTLHLEALRPACRPFNSFGRILCPPLQGGGGVGAARRPASYAPQGLDELLQFFTTAAQAKTSQATTAEQRVSIARITCRNKHGE